MADDPVAARRAEDASQFYIPATRNLHDGRLRTLKHGDSFALLDRHGDVVAGPGGVLGLYHRDTRHLTRFELQGEGWRPLLLSSNVQAPITLLAADLANPEIQHGDRLEMESDVVHILRSAFLDHSVFHQRLLIRSFSNRSHYLRLHLFYDADFRDVFEIRGMERDRSGELRKSIDPGGRVRFTYQGLDGIQRHTIIAFEPAPAHFDCEEALFELSLAPRSRTALFIGASCAQSMDEATPRRQFLSAMKRQRQEHSEGTIGRVRLESDNAVFNEILDRSAADLTMLITSTPYGPYPYAGVPWFSTPFGRDGIITALFLLWIDPSIAKGVLRYLAATQSQKNDPSADAEPGKILHETRSSEMANTGEVPFGLYYGSVDATPLFVILAGLYWRRTGDLDTIAELWPNIEAALAWTERYGDLDGDGFVEYAAKAGRGLINQGWKDSSDSICHADGTLAEGPIALVEVQAYVYAARRHGAELARQLGQGAVAAALEMRAAALRDAFEARFWSDEIDDYALALDGAKRRCAVRASNAGHALFGHIARPDRAALVAEKLLGAESFSGWGIRTLPSGEARYNPMSYHNGSVWPHDNAMIALGFAEYGLTELAAQLFEGLFEAARRFELRRLPELFCGFLRRRHGGPTAYPVACAPQAWSSAAPFALLQASLGLSFASKRGELRLHRPRLPEFLDRLAIKGVRMGENEIDIIIYRLGANVSVHARKRRGHLPVVVTL